MKNFALCLLLTVFAFSSVYTQSACPTSLPGYSVLGEYNDHKYYLSDQTLPWVQAAAAADAQGAYLVSIEDAAENNFIKSVVGSEIVFIGLNDAQIEGTFAWDSGEPFAYNNIGSGNNSTDADYGVFLFWNGQWGFDSELVWRKYIVEIPCGINPPPPSSIDLACPGDILLESMPNETVTAYWDLPIAITNCNNGGIVVTQTSGPDIGSNLSPLDSPYTVSYEASDACGNVANCTFTITVKSIGTTDPCTPTLTGYTALGQFNNHNYFISDNSLPWIQAQAQAAANGGYLATINDATENDFLRNNIGSNIAFIGLNDANAEGNLVWENGEALTYSNISGSNSASADYGIFYFWDGSWGFDSELVWRKHIVEIPCGITPPNPLPDLSLSNLSLAATSAIQGNIVDYSFDLHNTGNSTANGDYVIGVYLSTDTHFSIDDVKVGVVNTGNTPIGTIPNVPGAITIPTNQTPGDYYLILVADNGSVIAESNENNNQLVATTLLTVTEPTTGTCSNFDNNYVFNNFYLNCSSIQPDGNISIFSNGPQADHNNLVLSPDGVELSNTSTPVSLAGYSIVNNAIVETDFDGNVINTTPLSAAIVNQFGGNSAGYGSIVQSTSGEFFMGAYERFITSGNTEGYDVVYVLKVDGSGQEISSNAIDTSYSYNVYYNNLGKMIATPDGGAEIYYTTSSFNAYTYKVKVDANNQKLFRSTVAFFRNAYGSNPFLIFQKSPCRADYYNFEYTDVLSSGPHGGSIIQHREEVAYIGSQTIVNFTYSLYVQLYVPGGQSLSINRTLDSGDRLTVTYQSNSPYLYQLDTFLVSKYDDQQNLLWQKDYLLDFVPNDILELADGGIVFIYNNADFRVKKVCPGSPVVGIDLELGLTVSPPDLHIYTNNIFTVTLQNKGTEAAQNVEVDFQLPTGYVITSSTPSTGSYTNWTGEWIVGEVAAGASETLEVNLFSLTESAPITIFTEVSHHDGNDVDSTPGNGNGSSAVEDDEAVVIVAPTNSPSNKVLPTTSSFQLYPNPATDQLSVKLESETELSTVFEIYNSLGNLQLQLPIRLEKGSNLQTIDISSLPGGYYVLQIPGIRLTHQSVQFMKILD